jgi:4-alpha-glucanotransferase
MKNQSFQPLQDLASLHGIQSSYIDVAGRQQEARPETLVALLEALDIPASTPSEVLDSLRAGRRSDLDRMVPPVVIVWDGKTADVQFRVPEKWHRRNVFCHLQFEDGTVRTWSFIINQLRQRKTIRIDDTQFVTGKFSLPRMPFGYHRLEIGPAAASQTTLLISAPTCSYSSPDLQKAWGAFLPMYAAHSKSSWGSGNFTDWQRLADWVASLGGNLLSSLPVLGGFLGRNRCEPSPYSPATRLFWNEFFIDVTRVPEFAACPAAQKLANSPAFQRKLNKFRAESMVDYCGEMEARRETLEIMAEFFFSKSSQRRRQFQDFLRDRSQVVDYAEFRAADERLAKPWYEWPNRMRDGELRPTDYRELTARYHMYVQWLAQQQMDDLLKACREKHLHFYLDLPLGVNPAGYDVWRERESFALSVNAGAPPDAFFTKGQDWGFAPLHPERIREQGYRYVLEMLRFQMRHTGLLRVDHIMGLRRLYWIPQGHSAQDGAYVSYPADELYAILNVESHRNKTVIVGENLGTVPPEVNSAMTRHHLRKLFVVQYELRPTPKDALSQPERRVVASLNTHDMPTFAAFWNGDDLADRTDLGLIKKSDLPRAQEARRKLTQSLSTFLKRGGWLKTTKPNAEAAIKACLAFLASSDAEIVLVSLEDLWAETLSQNVPGTCSERPNWRRKAKLSLEQIEFNEGIKVLLENLHLLRGR